MEASEESCGWDEPMAKHLEPLLLENLYLIFQSAIVEITEWGYKEECAQKALLRRGLFVGSKNPVTTIVSDTLDCLTSKKKKVGSKTEETFEGLASLVEYTLLEMTGVLREVRPFLSAGEAMWWLLISDMNVLQACRLEEESSSKPGGSSSSSDNYAELLISQLRAHAQGSASDSAAFGEFLKQAKPRGPDGEDLNLGSMLKNLDSFLGVSAGNPRIRCQVSGSGSGSGNGRKGHSRKEIARWASTYQIAGKSCRGHGSKTLIAKHGSAIENKLKAGSSKAALAKKSPELSEGDHEYYKAIPYDRYSGKYIPRDEKDELILKLVPRLQHLRKELQGWTEWANQKIMQAARKLGKIKPELKTMRQVTEASKTFLKEDDTKRIAIMENGVEGIQSLADKGKEIIRSLEEQNSLLRRALKIAKAKAEEFSEDHEAALEREQKAQKEIQTWDGKIGSMQKDLDAAKKQFVVLQCDLGKAKNDHIRWEARLEAEKNEIGTILTQANLMTKEREKLEARAKSDEERLESKARSVTQKSLKEIRELEVRLSEAVSRSDSSRLAALKRGSSESFGKRGVDAKSFANTTGVRNFEERFGIKSVRQDRECVMCLSEEIKVVFVPCSHQVLCEECNDLHVNRGLNDCPSCRTLIQRRINVRFADSQLS